MIYGYSKQEKLKKKKHIDLLFSQGDSVSKYPLRLVLVPIHNTDGILEMGVSVSKKFFKRAVDRNYYKRVLRECYRKNQYMLKDALPEPYAMMLFYQTKERLGYADIEIKTRELFEKCIDFIAKKQALTSSQ